MKQPDHLDRLTLSKREIARELRVSVRTLERLRAGGHLPPTLPGFGHPRWSTAAVRAWIDGGGAETSARRE